MSRKGRIFLAVFCTSFMLFVSGSMTAFAAGKEGSASAKGGTSLPEVTGVQIKDNGKSKGKEPDQEPDQEPKTGEGAPVLLFAGTAATGLYLVLSLRERLAEN